MGRTFEDPNKATILAIEFNKQIFLVGKGLFIHLMKYFPSSVSNLERTSRSKAEWNVTGFARATRGYKTHFKGFKFDYVEIPRELKEQIRPLSKIGEGWWPERSILKQPGVDYELNLQNFLMNYEGPGYYRRLGRGINVPLTDKVKYQSGVEFTREGLELALQKFRLLGGRYDKTMLPRLSRHFEWFSMEQAHAPIFVLRNDPYWFDYMRRVDAKKQRRAEYED